jgi:drug/metabolite transporter (DMT)-like permease
MPFVALLMVLVAAGIHTAWNLQVKRAGERQIFLWWGVVVSAFIISPVVILQPLPAAAWPYIIGSALAEAAYIITLAYAYRLSDFSLIYPIARGTAPLFLLVWTVLFLGEQPKTLGVIGLSSIMFGLMIVGANGFWDRRENIKLQFGVIGIALGVAVCISIYSVIDGAATRFTPPLSYLAVVMGLTAIFTAPFILGNHGRRAIVVEFRAHWRSLLAVGGGIVGAYVLVLYAYTMARVSYVGAAREISIVFAAFVGWRWLGERFGVLRLVGALLLFSGVCLISLAG